MMHEDCYLRRIKYHFLHEFEMVLMNMKLLYKLVEC